MLATETIIGLTFGQILAVIGLVIAMIKSYTSLVSRIAVLETSRTDHENKHKDDKEALSLTLTELKTNINSMKELLIDTNTKLHELIGAHNVTINNTSNK